MTDSTNQPLPLESRKAALQARINHYLGQGYRVVSQTDTTAQLVKPKTFSCLFAVILFVLMVLPFIIYLLYYMSKKDEVVYLSVDDYGKVSERR